MSGFWTRFARRSIQLGALTLLQNQALPMLEVNALYGDSALQQPILIRPNYPETCQLEDCQLEGYDLAGTLVALEFLPDPPDPRLWVEQVAWTQAPRLAGVWCDHNNANDWQEFVTRELARSLESHPDLLAYLAYSGDNAMGMMIVSSDGICGLWAGMDDVALALFARGASDLGQLEVIVPIERRAAFASSAERERFLVWLIRHQPSDAQTKPTTNP